MKWEQRGSGSRELAVQDGWREGSLRNGRDEDKDGQAEGKQGEVRLLFTMFEYRCGGMHVSHHALVPNLLSHTLPYTCI